MNTKRQSKFSLALKWRKAKTLSKNIRLGTRGSLLARTQSTWVANQVASDRSVELVVIKTQGDDLSLSLTNLSTPGAFVNALRAALINGDVDFIVHSFKDLPSQPHPELEIVAIPVREDPRDVFICNDNVSFKSLTAGSVVGTSSPRRVAAVRKLKSEILTRPIRGNIDSRIRKVRDGQYDGVILAAAGLIRIGLSSQISEYFAIEELLPAPAQGALAVECRKNDAEMLRLLSPISDPITRLTTTAERAVLRGLNAGCDLAVGAYATYADEVLTLTAEIADPMTGSHERIVLTKSALAAEELGLAAANHFLASEIGKRILQRDN